MDEIVLIDNPQAPQLEELASFGRAAMVAENGRKKVRHKCYDITIELAKEMSPHAFGTVPTEKLMQYRPMEPKEIRDYREKIYEPKTYQAFQRAQSIASRVLSESMVSVEYPPVKTSLITDSDSPKTYFETRFFGDKSATQYTQQVVLPKMLGDANGALILERETPDGDKSFPIIRPLLYRSEAILDFIQRQWFLILTDEKSDVMVANSRERTGNVMRFYNRFGVYRIYQTGEKSKDIYAAEILYNHNMDECPVRVLGGIAVSEESKTYWKSFFAAAVPSWNVAMRQESDLQASIVKHVFPQRVLMYKSCSSCAGVGTRIDSTGKSETCGTCSGTGKIGGHATGPFTTIEIDQKFGQDIKPSDLVHVIPEDVTFLEYLEKSVDKEIAEAFKALNLQAAEGVNELNSGVAKTIDRGDMNEFLKAIASQSYDLLQFILSAGIKLRYGVISGNDKLIPSVVGSMDFDFASVDTLIAESKAGKEAGLPQSYIGYTDKQIAIRQYGSDSAQAQRVCASIDLNPYYGKSADEAMAVDAISPGTIDPLQYFISVNIDRLISLAIEKDANFLFMELPQQRKAIEAIAIGMRGDNTMADDPEAAAKAKIRGSVGGVQALIEMNAAVARGEMSTDSAIALIVAIYGIDETIASKLIEEMPRIEIAAPIGI